MPVSAGLEGDGALVWGFSITMAGLAFEVFSSHCSSPWTSETFGADPAKAASARRYAWKSAAVSMGLGLGGVMVARDVRPLVAMGVVSVYMLATYELALRKAARSGSTGWSDKGEGGDGAGVKFGQFRVV